MKEEISAPERMLISSDTKCMYIFCLALYSWAKPFLDHLRPTSWLLSKYAKWFMLNKCSSTSLFQWMYISVSSYLMMNFVVKCCTIAICCAKWKAQHHYWFWSRSHVPLPHHHGVMYLYIIELYCVVVCHSTVHLSSCTFLQSQWPHHYEKGRYWTTPQKILLANNCWLHLDLYKWNSKIWQCVPGPVFLYSG